MARRYGHWYGHWRRGEPARRRTVDHWKTTTFVAGLRRTRMVAQMVLDGAINRDAFLAHAD
jgi:hypothetical protein